MTRSIAFPPTPFALGVRREPFEGVHRDRFVQIPAVAHVLTRVIADATTRRRQRVSLTNQRDRLSQLALRDERDVPLHVDSRRTRQRAGRRSLLVDCVHVGDCLWIELVDDAAWSQALVELVRQMDGAHGFAIAAGVALVGVHVGRATVDRQLHGAGLAVRRQQLRVRDDVDVRVLVAVHEPRRDGAHCAVVRRERLV